VLLCASNKHDIQFCTVIRCKLSKYCPLHDLSEMIKGLLHSPFNSNPSKFSHGSEEAFLDGRRDNEFSYPAHTLGLYTFKKYMEQNSHQCAMYMNVRVQWMSDRFFRVDSLHEEVSTNSAQSEEKANSKCSRSSSWSGPTVSKPWRDAKNERTACRKVSLWCIQTYLLGTRMGYEKLVSMISGVGV